MTTNPIHSISIPAQVCFDRALSPAAKLLYGEIAFRCQQEGSCPLNKHYFAMLFEVSFKSVATWVAQLEKAGYLRIRYDPTGQQQLIYLEEINH